MNYNKMVFKLFAIFLTFLNMATCITGLNCYTSKDIITEGLVSYQNKVYDIENYKHPGGKNTLLLCKVKPLEDFFKMDEYSFHVTSELTTEHLKKIYVGELRESCINKTSNFQVDKFNILNKPGILYSVSSLGIIICLITFVGFVNIFGVSLNRNVKIFNYYVSIGNFLFGFLYLTWWISLMSASFLTGNVLENLGIWISLNIAFTLFPATRNSAWVNVLKIRYNKLISNHKFIAILTTLSVIIKIIACVVYYKFMFLFSNMSNIMGFTSSICLIILSIL